MITRVNFKVNFKLSAIIHATQWQTVKWPEIYTSLTLKIRKLKSKKHEANITHCLNSCAIKESFYLIIRITIVLFNVSDKE